MAPAKFPLRQRNLARPLIVALLALSLLANAALFFTRVDESSHVSARSVTSKPTSAVFHTFPLRSASIDLQACAASLHNSVLPNYLIRAFIAAEIDEKFRAREAVLLPPKDASLQWWQTDNRPVPLASHLGLLALHREKSRLRGELLGPDPDAPDDGWSLSPAKREAAYRLTADYTETIDAITWGGISSRLLLPAEKAALASLEERRNAEQAALLTPAELADFELRTSDSTQLIRHELRGFDATDQEFAAILEFWGKNDAEQGVLGHLFVSEEKIDSPLKTLLGEERFAEFQRARNIAPELEKIRSLVQRASLPPETADQVLALRLNLEQESARIGGDSGSVAEKLAALQALARDTRENIRAKLGPDAAAAYLPNAEQWLSLVERGNVIHFQPHGWEGRGVTGPRPPNVPAATP